MHLNRLMELKPYTWKHFTLRKLGDHLENSSSDEDTDDEEENVVAFDMDSELVNGRLALLYNGTTKEPKIYF